MEHGAEKAAIGTAELVLIRVSSVFHPWLNRRRTQSMATRTATRWIGVPGVPHPTNRLLPPALAAALP